MKGTNSGKKSAHDIAQNIIDYVCYFISRPSKYSFTQEENIDERILNVKYITGRYISKIKQHSTVNLRMKVSSMIIMMINKF